MFIDNMSAKYVRQYCNEHEINYSTSFGKKKSCIDSYPVNDAHNNKNGVWIRVSIGYNESDNDFTEFLNIIKKIEI